MNTTTTHHPEETQSLYQYRECGLDNVYLDGGYERVESPYGSGVRIHDLDGLHRCIAQFLVDKARLLTGAEFRFLRLELDLSQATMGLLCGRGERMVREWETRDEPVEDPANTIIRFVYRQRYEPEANFEEVTKQIKRLQELDKELHEFRLKITNNSNEGWKAACLKAA